MLQSLSATELKSLSVGELKRRIKDLGLEPPPHVVEKSELQAFLEDALAARGADAAERSAGDSRPASSDMKVADLKDRLRKLGLEPPTTVMEKSELVQLVKEAERQSVGAAESKPAQAPAPANSDSIPKPWYRKESSSFPGHFYFVNAETGVSSWTLPTEDVGEDSIEIVADKVADPAPGPNAPSKHDYRDDAFAQDAPAESPAPDPLELSWSRAGSMTCSLGAGGVTALTMDVLPEPSPSNSSSAVEGETFTWVRGPMIGRGALGRVFKALDQKSGKIIAVKEVLTNPADPDDSKFIEDLKNEVDIMKGLEHPHIVSYLGHDYIDSCLYMYLEHMSGGTVTQALQQFGAFEELLLADYAKQVLHGLEYLHTSDPPVVHRDIKGSNILLGLDCKAKLADFGCSRRTNQTLTHTMRGSVPWMAPEVIAFSRFGRSADIWSFGCFTIEMGTAYVPWGRFDNQMAALLKIGMSKALPKLPEGISETCEDFMKRCLQREAEKRPSATELLNHELLKVIVTDF